MSGLASQSRCRRPFDPRPFINLKTVPLFGADHFAERLPSPGWIVWYKRLGHDRNDQADCEIAWINVLTLTCPPRNSP